MQVPDLPIPEEAEALLAGEDPLRVATTASLVLYAALCSVRQADVEQLLAALAPVWLALGRLGFQLQLGLAEAGPVC